MDPKEIREKLAALYKEGKPLAERSQRGELDEAGEKRLADISTEAQALAEQLIEAEARATRNAAILDGNQQFNAPATRQSGRQPAQGQQGGQGEQRGNQIVSLGRRYAESEELLNHQRAGVHGAGGRMELESLREERALVYTGALPAGFIEPQRVPGIFTPDRPELTVRNAFLSGQTNSDTIEFYRETSFTNNAAWVGQASATTGSTGLKPESGIAFEKDSTLVKTQAHWIPITRQTVWDAPMIQSIIETRLIEGLADVEDAGILNGDGTGDNLKGLLSYSGLQDLDATYFAANPVKDAGTDNENFNRVLRGRQNIRYIGRARASFIFIHPSDMERFLTTTDANRQYMAGGPFSNGVGVTRLWGLNVIETEELDEGSVVIGDGRKAQVWDRMQAAISIGYINDQFVRNMFTILAEERLAFAVYRPQAFAVVELAA